MNENPTQPNNTPPVVVAPEPQVPQIVTKPRSFLIPLFVLFLLVSAGAIAYMLVRQSTPTPAPPPVVVMQPTSIPFFLSVDNLNSEVTSVNGEVLVSGKTLPNSTVLIYTDVDDASVQSNPDGSFESTVLVNDASGLVRVSAISDAGEEKNLTFSVTNNTDVLGKSDSSPSLTKENNAEEKRESEIKTQKNKNSERKNSESDSMTTKDDENTSTEQTTEESGESSENEDSDPATEKQQKLERIREFIEVKEPSEKVRKIGINKIREIITKKDAEESTGEATMKEERMEIKVQKMIARQASDTAVLKRSAVSGIVSSVNGSTLTIVHQIQRERVFTVHYNANTIITSQDGKESLIPVFTVGMRIAAVGEPIGEDLLAKRIHIIPGKASGVLLKRPLATGSAEIEASPSATVSGTVSPTVTLAPSPEDTITLSPSPTEGIQ